MLRWLKGLVLMLALLSLQTWAAPEAFVVQFTRADGLNNGHHPILLQIDPVLKDIGADKVHFTVVAYEEGVHVLRADNQRTASLVNDLAAVRRL